jgi:hypothetical protein
MRPGARVVASGIAGLLAGVSLGLLVGGSGEPPAPGRSPPTGSAAGPVEELRRELSLARRERDALALQLDALEREEAEPARPAADAEPEESGSEPDRFLDEPWLRERGFPESEIARLRERWDQAELDRLYLIDLAKREGWHGTQRFRDRNREIHEQLREELCDDGYDALLYATGKGNRVVVADVLADSPAARAGLEPGDAIRSYADRRLFTLHGLVLATAGGEPGRPTEVRIERGGGEIRVFVPRGPLGVRIRRERRVPDTLRWPLACRGRG